MPVGIRMAVNELFHQSGIDFENDILKHCKSAEVKEFLTIPEAAEIANVSPSTIRRMCAKNLFKWNKLNPARCGRIIIEKSSFLSFLEGPNGTEG